MKRSSFKSPIIISVSLMSILMLVIWMLSYIISDRLLGNEFEAATGKEENTVQQQTKTSGDNGLDFSKPIAITWSNCLVDSPDRKAQQISAEQYMKNHPSVRITMIQKHPLDYYNWIKARVAAGDAPDIVTIDNMFDRTIVGSRDHWFANMSSYLQKTNPYTGIKWQYELMQRGTWNSMVLGSYYTMIPSLAKSYKFIYNKDQFLEAGITEQPKTWKEFMTTLKALNHIGLTSFGIGISDSFDQMTTLCNYITDHVYYSKINGIDVFPRDGVIETEEMVRALDLKLINVKDPEMTKALELFKDFHRYWNSDYVDATDADITQRFMDGKVSVILGSSWDLPEYSSQNKINWGVFSFPIITSEDLPSSTGRVMEPEPVETAYAVSNDAIQRGTVDYCADFLMTFTTYNAMNMFDNSYILRRGNEVYSPQTGSDTAGSNYYTQFDISGEVMPNATPAFYSFNNRDIQADVCHELIQYIDGEISAEEFLIFREKSAEDYANKLKIKFGWSFNNE